MRPFNRDVMSSKRTNDKMRARLLITSARWKAASAEYCANVLRPDLDEAGKRKLANAILSLGDNLDRPLPKRRITPAVVEEMFFRQAQCNHPKCPLLLFSDQLAEELNAYFGKEE